MQAALFQFASLHTPVFVVTALVICLTGGWLLSALLMRAEQGDFRVRRYWLVGSALVAGIAIWTTHFVAMLGYRPDLLLSFNPTITAASALIGVIAVGIPLALSAMTKRRPLRIALGAMAGAGIGAMHLAGMSAIEGCIQVQSWGAAGVAYVIGALCLGTARGIPENSRYGWRTAALVTLGVVSAHFISVAGDSLVQVSPSPNASHDNLVLTVFTAAGAAVLLLGAFLALLTVRRFEAQEREHSAVLATALDNMSNGLLFVGPTGTLDLFNQRALEIFDLSAGTLRHGMSPEELVKAVGDANSWTAEMSSAAVELITTRSRSAALERTEHRLAQGRVLEIESRPVRGGGVVFTLDDVTVDREAKSQIEHLAFHDPLTGLPNRRALNQRMIEGFSPKLQYKLLLIDLDRFKAVNDTFGHAVGDQLLIQVAGRLRDIVGPEGFAARLGGDEMAALVYGDFDLSLAIADQIVESVNQPFVIGDTTVAVGCSIGMCCTDDAANPEELMQRADVALFDSKRHGRGRASCYRPGMLEEVTRRHQLENDMLRALAEGQFFLVYQPVLALAIERVIGYEALIRWQHPTLGLIPPGLFIPLAEESGRILDIGRWVLRRACEDAASWPEDVHVAVNASPAQFRSPHFLNEVQQALADSGLPARRLELELTETAILRDNNVISQALDAIRELGIKIAMDDFGTGYSSLAHLRDLPLDRIKIDQSFVSTAASDRHSMAVLRAVTQIGHDLGIPTIAEGVETVEQLELVRSLGCDAVQGYLIGKPERLVDADEARLRA